MSAQDDHQCVLYRTYHGYMATCRCGRWWMLADTRSLTYAFVSHGLLERLREHHKSMVVGQAASLAEAVKAATAAELARREQEHAMAREKWHKQQKTKRSKWWACIRLIILRDPCAYCGDPQPTVVDHIVPVSQDGLTVRSNLAPACVRCNSTKGGRTPEQWRALREERGLPWPPAWESTDETAA